MRGALAIAALGGTGAWYLRSRDAQAYGRLAGDIWQGPAPAPDPLIELVRCGTLAPNSHNTQPWRFVLSRGAVRVLPDTARRTPVVDPDDHHLYTSLGCALETMVQAAPAIGLATEAEVSPDGVALLRAMPGPRAPTALSDAIPRRRSIRLPFDDAPLARGDLAALEAAAGADERVGLVLVTDAPRRASLAELVLAGNSVQLRDRAFVAELASWIRFSHAEALARRDGLFAGASGNPVLPGVIARPIFDRVFTLAGETDRMARQLAGSSGFAVFAAAEDDPTHWVAVGRAAQRFCLQATALGLRTSWVNQPVEVPPLRRVLASWLALGDSGPDLVLRFGRGPDLPASLRRPVGEVIMEQNA